MLDSAPGGLEQDPVLGVHQPDLAGRHTEERRVEPRHIVDEARAAGHDLAGRAWLGVEELVDVPTVLGHLRDRVAAFAQNIPELVGIRCPGKAGGIAHDGETGGLLGGTLVGHSVVLLARFGGSLQINADENYSTQGGGTRGVAVGSQPVTGDLTVTGGMLFQRSEKPEPQPVYQGGWRFAHR